MAVADLFEQGYLVRSDQTPSSKKTSLQKTLLYSIFDLELCQHRKGTKDVYWYNHHNRIRSLDQSKIKAYPSYSSSLKPAQQPSPLLV
jgi:hypothetical protein